MNNVKDTNPKDAVGTKKVPISTVPCGPILLAGLAMLEGARKYGRHNYRAAGVRASVYYDAVVGRHIMPWWEGQDIDPDSGLNHIDKAIAGLVVLRDSMLSGNWIDDRPIRNLIDLKGLNAKAAAIIERYPNAKDPFTEVGPESPNAEAENAAQDAAYQAEIGPIMGPARTLPAEAGSLKGTGLCEKCAKRPAVLWDQCNHAGAFSLNYPDCFQPKESA